MITKPLKLTIAAAAATAMVGCAEKEQSALENVNILWLWGEDISPWMPAYGDSTVVTPNIDFLADNGVTYLNCYAPCSVSSPTRSAVMTGMMQTSIGMHNHRTGRSPKLIYSLPEGITPMPVLFKEAGFHTYNAGKDDFNWHYEWNDYWTGPHETVKFYGKEGSGDWNDRSEGQRFWGVVELYGGKNHKKPKNPVDVEKVKVPSYYPNTKRMRTQLATHYNQIIQTDIEIGNMLEKMKADGVYENTIIIFLSDNGYQTLRDKQFLYDGGIHMPFIISAPGNPELLKELNIEKGSVRDDLMSLIDVSATTLRMAGIEIPSYMEAKDILADDFHRDYIVAARDRCDFTIDRIRAIRTKDFKYIRNFMTDRPLMQAQYRDKQKWYKDFMKEWKVDKVKFEDGWLSDKRPAEELYDLKNDPEEVHNLVNDPKFASQLNTMRGYLESWIKETKDQGAIPECKEELEIVYERWGERCVNPEYDVVKKKAKGSKK